MSEVPRSLKHWSINLEQILFLLQGYYFNFYASVKRKMWGANYKKSKRICHLFYPTLISIRKHAQSKLKLSPHIPPNPISLLKSVLFQNEKAIFLGFIILSNSQPSFLIFRCILNPSCNVLLSAKVKYLSK